jgi:signal transduction histidine kinase
MSSNRPSHDATNAGLPPSESTDLSRRLAFLELDESDRARLRELGCRLGPSVTRFVDVFYRHLFRFEETARFLRDPDLVARLKEAQRQHLESMLQADWGDEYVARRYRVGEVHAQVGINPQTFLGAYNQYMQFCLRELSTQCDRPLAEFADQVGSLQKAVFLDIGLALEAYFTQATQALRQALDLVYRANTELRQFAQLTSHDLKTPLATMANLCDEALDEFGGEIPQEAASLVRAARDRAFRMSRTIDELLSSTMSLHTETSQDRVPSEEVISEAIDQVRALLDQKSIQLTVTAELPTIFGDRARLREVFYNLLSNAIKFSDKPRGRIDVGCTIRDSECIFTVADNGPGIPAEELSRIFVPFRRLPAHRNVPGSGLGLYFAKTMVEQQQGRIWIESEVGKGSTFYVLLKLAHVPDSAA